MADHDHDQHDGVGEGPPLVLLHGASMSGRAWRPVRAELERHHRVLVPTLLGHRGGPRWSGGRFTVDGVVDAVEDALDAAGIGHAHLAGNSLGGWVALELARRGRARSVTAFSPAGAWRSALDLRRLVWTFRAARLAARPAWVDVLAARPRVRRALLRGVLEHGERVPTRDVPDLLADVRGCEVLTDLLAGATVDGRFARLDPLPCPVRVVWGEHDRILPWARHGVPWRRVLPGAGFTTLPGVGHVPMWDDPAGVVDAVLGVTLPGARSPSRPPAPVPTRPEARS